MLVLGRWGSRSGTSGIAMQSSSSLSIMQSCTGLVGMLCEVHG